MPLLVVPLGADETGLLTLDEWTSLMCCEQVFFESDDHPLMERLQAAGVKTASLEGAPDADVDGSALIAEPSSDLLVRLARAGAEVSSGPCAVPDSLTAAHGAYVARRVSRSATRLACIMARLRSDDGCPWDREQTHSSLTPHLLEEAHEVIDAIERDRLRQELQEELGDLLLQVAFHAELAAGDRRFDLSDVADRIAAKLVHRHPHVFADVVAETAGEVVRNWDEIKASEKLRNDPWEDIPRSLPALVAASKTQKRAAALGFRADEVEARARLDRALEDHDGVGDAIFWLVALARTKGIDPEGALRQAIVRFRGSFK